MPKSKKKPSEMTTEELERHLFPKKVVEELKRVAQESDKKSDEKEKRASS